jgi:3-oxoacyl-[acyl-carrier protein] reductase
VSPRLDGKVAIITGAGSTIGLGHAMALALVAAGARVTLTDVNEAALQATAEEARRLGGANCVLPIVADVARASDAEMTVQRTLAELGGLHLLVNNAGKQIVRVPNAPVPWSGPFWETRPDQWDMMVSINLSGAFYMARASVGHMLAQGWGRIVGVTTSLTAMAGRGVSPYGPVKAAHDALVATMAGDLDGTGVTSNVLIPGSLTMTGMVPREIAQTSWLEPEVMQKPIVWFASDEANGVNGRRFLAVNWDERLPLDERIQKASTPLGWPIPTA